MLGDGGSPPRVSWSGPITAVRILALASLAVVPGFSLEQIVSEGRLGLWTRVSSILTRPHLSVNGVRCLAVAGSLSVTKS